MITAGKAMAAGTAVRIANPDGAVTAINAMHAATTPEERAAASQQFMSSVGSPQAYGAGKAAYSNEPTIANMEAAVDFSKFQSASINNFILIRLLTRKKVPQEVLPMFLLMPVCGRHTWRHLMLLCPQSRVGHPTVRSSGWEYLPRNIRNSRFVFPRNS